MKKRELVEQAAKRHNVSGVEGACKMLADSTQDLLNLGDDQYGETAEAVAELAAQLLGNPAASCG